MAKTTNWALSAIKQTAVPGSLTLGATNQILNQENWSEDFQDLSVYCNIGSKMADNSAQQLGEQLNTPIITVQNGFDFNGSRHPSAGELYDDVDPWGAQNDNKINTQTQLWCTVSDWLSTSTNQQDINDREDIVDVGVDIDDVADETNYDIVIEEQPQQQLPPQQHLISSGRDYLLSQSSDYRQKTSPLFEMTRETTHIDLTNDIYIKPEPQFYEPGNLQPQQQQLLSLNNVCNNNSNSTVNINEVLNSDKISCINNFSLKSQGRDHKNLVVQPTSKANLNPSFEVKNRRDPFISSKYLSSIIKSEEPLIGGESVKQLFRPDLNSNNSSANVNIAGSKTVSDTGSSVNVSAIIITPESVATTSTGSNNIKLITKFSSNSDPIISASNPNSNNSSFKLILSDPPVKTEPIDNIGMEVEVVDEPTTDVVHYGIKKFKTLPQNLKRAGLKLDIDSASKFVPASVIPTLESSIDIATTCDIIDTPEVLRPLLPSKGFNLLDYISGDGGGRDVLNSPSVFSGFGFDSLATENKKNVAVIRPVVHGISKNVIVEKCASVYDELPALPVVEEVDEAVKEEKCEESQSAFGDDSLSTFSERLTNMRRKVSKRKRIVKKSEDMESDLSNLSDFIEEDDEKHDKTFRLSSVTYKRKRTTSSTSRTSTEQSRSTERKPSYGKQRKMSRDTDSSDHDSIASTMDRYRELRDRNNEASRRSRLNRKSRESEMKEHAIRLQEENRRLKAKADEMERLVKRLREGLMQLVLKKR